LAFEFNLLRGGNPVFLFELSALPLTSHRPRFPGQGRLLKSASAAKILRQERSMNQTDIKYSACYSNGIYGSKWSVFQITREHDDATVSFKIVAGAGRRKSGTLPCDEFARWAKYEIVLKENEWVKLVPDRFREPE
jgi:hypothetical protein